jgi:EAL domain-containing protein (putative c-di-GMP-specific phosphodiesterase class I)
VTTRPVVLTPAEAHTCALVSREAVVALTGEVDVVVALQPIVSLSDMTLRGVEALARFPAPPTAPPNVWFARAERAGVARRLELAVVRRALHLWQRDPVGDYVAVNVSARTLVDPALLTVLLEADVPYGSVVVEMTEHSRVDDDDEALAAIDRLRAAGARVALDDVGAGFASLELARRLRPDVIKIDAGVIAQLRSVPCELLIAGAAVSVARELGASVAVEGVETLDDLHSVRALGADEAQGFFFGRPSADRSVWRRWAQRARQRPARLPRPGVMVH